MGSMVSAVLPITGIDKELTSELKTMSKHKHTKLKDVNGRITHKGNLTTKQYEICNEVANKAFSLSSVLASKPPKT